MSRKKLLSGKDRKMIDLAEKYETAEAENKRVYMDADDLADLADWYAVRGKFQQALGVVEYGLQLHPGDTALLVEQAYLFIDIQRIDDARRTAAYITEDYLPEVKILKAYLLMDEGKTAEAEQLIDSIEDKDDLPNIIEIAYLYIDMDDPEKAAHWLERGKTRYEDNESYLTALASYYGASGQTEEASVYYNKLIDINPYAASYWYGLARCYFDLEEFEKAIDACDYATVSDEEYGDPYLLRGHAFFHLGNDEKALENYRMAIKYGTIDADFINAFVGMSKISQEKWEEAYRYIRLAIENVEKSIVPLELLYANAALCLHKLGRNKEAHNYCRMAYKLNPAEVDAYLIEGRIYQSEGNASQALRQWIKAIRKAPYADTWNEVGMSCLETGEIRLASIAFEHVKRIEPDFAGINEKLAIVSLLLHDKENFAKYNVLCQRPIGPDEQKLIEEAGQSDDLTQLLQAVTQILDMLK